MGRPAIMGTVGRKKTMSPSNMYGTCRRSYISTYVQIDCAASHSEQPRASNIQNVFLRVSGVTALISSAPLTNRGMKQSRMLAAEVRGAPPGTHSQTAMYPPSTMSQAVATYHFPRDMVFIVRLILHSIVTSKGDS